MLQGSDALLAIMGTSIENLNTSSKIEYVTTNSWNDSYPIMNISSIFVKDYVYIIHQLQKINTRLKHIMV